MGGDIVVVASGRVIERLLRGDVLGRRAEPCAYSAAESARVLQDIHGEADVRAHRTYAVLLAWAEAEEPGVRDAVGR